MTTPRQKLIWLALQNITAKWERMSHYWRSAMNQFAILYEGRFPPSSP
jgi:transposase-like protein